jgi:hypothetical protein
LVGLTYLTYSFRNNLTLTNTKFDGHFTIIEVSGAIAIDSDSSISSDGHIWYGNGFYFDSGGSFGGVGGNWQKDKINDDRTYGSHDRIFKKEFIKVISL